MAEEVKEKLTTQEANGQAPVNNDVEENVEDYFNPFADVSENEEVEEVEEEKVEEKKEAPVVIDNTHNELQEVKATVQAQREVAKLVKENSMYADYADEIAEITAKAIVRGHKNPVEFAIRNIKSPSEWIEIGRKSGIQDAGIALKSNVGGSSFSRSEATAPDFNTMSSNDFEKFVNSVKNS